MSGDRFREPPVLDSIVQNAATELQSEYERRTALEALAAWHMGYSWLLVASPEPRTQSFSRLDGFDVSMQAAFIGKHHKPDPNTLPADHRCEIVNLAPLEDPSIRKQVFELIHDPRE